MKLHVVLLISAAVAAGTSAAVVALTQQEAVPSNSAPDRAASAHVLTQIQEDLKSMKSRLSVLEQQPKNTSAPQPSSAQSEKPAPTPAIGTTPKPSSPIDPALLKDMQAYINGTLPSSEKDELFERIRAAKAQDEYLRLLQEEIERNPGVAKAHFNLAMGLIQRLLVEPDGPSRGAWAEKAMGSFDKALELDPYYWDARYAKAVSLSWYPEQLGRTPDAIAEFEKALQVQGTSTANPQYADTYANLARLYTKVGKNDKAQALLQQGLQLFPGNENLTKQLTLLLKK